LSFSQVGDLIFEALPDRYRVDLPKGSKIDHMEIDILEQSNPLNLNAYAFSEYKIDVSKLKLKGSDSALNPVPTQFSGIVIVPDYGKIATDAFANCRNDDKCKFVI
jgi:hypothetical protein